MAEEEKRIHELNETSDKTDKFVALDEAGLAEAVKYNVNNFIDKAQTDNLYVKLVGAESVEGVKTWVNQGVFQAGIEITAGNLLVTTGKIGINDADPDYPLDVNGIIGLKGVPVLDFVSNVTYLKANSRIELQPTDGNSLAYFNSNGTVGIGTNTGLTDKLTVDGDLQIRESNSPRIYIKDTAGGVNEKEIFITAGGGNFNVYNFNDDRTVLQQIIGTTRSGINVQYVYFPNGNVGIGTDTPDRTLKIRGTNPILSMHSDSPVLGFEIKHLDTGAAAILLESAGLLTIGTSNTDAGAQVSIVAGNETEAIRINNNGNVGIGTDSPLNKLDVGNFPIDIGDVGMTLSSSTSGHSIRFGLRNGDRLWIIENDGSDSDKFIIRDGTKSLDRFIIDKNGNVGIKTNNPSSELTLIGEFALSNTTSTGINTHSRIKGYHYTKTEDNISLISNTSTSTNNTIYIGGGVSGMHAATNIIFYTASTNTTNIGTERMRIINNGNIGIGISSPASKLHIYENTSNVGASAGLTIEQDGAGDSLLIFTLTGTARYQMGIDNSSSDSLCIGAGNDFGTIKYFEFWPDNIIYSPAIRDNTTASGASVYCGSSTGDLARSTSSIKVKTNVNYKIDPTLVFKLKPCSFNSKIDDNKAMIGFIAEQVNKIDERFANGEGELMGLEINAILAATVAGLQGINTRLKKLETKRK